jgi:hypothetical protein
MEVIYHQAQATWGRVHCSQQDGEAMTDPPSSSSPEKASLSHLAFWSLMASCCSWTLPLGFQGGDSMVQEHCICSGLSVPADTNTIWGIIELRRLQIRLLVYRFWHIDITQRTRSIFSWHISLAFPQNVPWQAALTSWSSANIQVILPCLYIFTLFVYVNKWNYLWHQ